MPRPGRLLVQAQQQDAMRNKPCEQCGHPLGEHRGHPRYLPIESLEEIAHPRPNPEYRACHFHCCVEGCGCVLVVT